MVTVGIDVQPIDEVAASLSAFGSRYTRRIFTAHELACCGDDPATASRGLAARFAAKEATLKVLDPDAAAPAWTEIEVRRDDGRAPRLVLHGAARSLARRRRIKGLSVSLSHAGGIAAAAVVAVGPRRRTRSTR